MRFDGVKQIVFFIVLAAVFILAVVPQEAATITTGWDKLNHVLAFFVLLALFDYAYPAMPFWSRQWLWLLAYGLLIECVQGFTADRYFSLLDILADMVGLLAYGLIRPLIITYLPFSDRADFH